MRVQLRIVPVRRVGADDGGTRSGATPGFTIVESLVAVAVLTTIIFAPMSIITQVLVQGALTESNIRANLLAQEVIEYVRYTRDTNILSSDGGDWFDNLYLSDSENPYIGCVVDQGDWVTATHNDYCVPQCDGNDCGNADAFDNYVDGVSTNDNSYGGNREATCDGKSAKENGAFTTTLTIAVPPEESKVRYAVAESCVSWEDKVGEARKVIYREAMFEWLTRQ